MGVRRHCERLPTGEETDAGKDGYEMGVDGDTKEET